MKSATINPEIEAEVISSSKERYSIFDNIRINVLKNLFIPRELREKFHVYIETEKGQILIGEEKSSQAHEVEKD